MSAILDFAKTAIPWDGQLGIHPDLIKYGLDNISAKFGAFARNWTKISRIDQEPRGVSLAGKVTNFYGYYDVCHGPQVEERHVCRVPCGGCGNEGGKSGTQKMG